MTTNYTIKKNVKDSTHSFKTLKGDMVRSKNEVIIANLLYLSNIEYKYEGQADCKEHNECPDFTIITKNSGNIIWEHLSYNEKTDSKNSDTTKIQNYLSTGYFLDNTLFISSSNETEGKKNIDSIYTTFERVKKKYEECK
jgi:hypothetical protein